MADSRIVNILENILGADNELLPPESRNEKILYRILGLPAEIETPPQSRIEELLIEILNEDYQSFRSRVDGSITEVTGTMLQGITSIYSNAFRACLSLTSVEIPEGITSIGEAAFYACYALSELSLPSSLTTIGANAFYSCSSLPEIQIPEGVAAINANTFKKCELLTGVELPSTITSIGGSAFDSCSALETLTIKATTPPSLTASALSGVPATISIQVPASAVDAYKAATNWSTYADNIEAIST